MRANKVVTDWIEYREGKKQSTMTGNNAGAELQEIDQGSTLKTSFEEQASRVQTLRQEFPGKGDSKP